MLFTTIKEFLIQYDEESGLLRAEWRAGQDMQHLRPALLQLQLLTKQLQVSKVLYDMDAMADLSVFDQIWAATTWLPSVMQLPLKQVVIVIGAKRVYNQQAVEVLLHGFKLFMKFDAQFFTQPLPGLQWLLGNSPRLPEMLAEWQAGVAGRHLANQDSASLTMEASGC